MKPPKDDLKAGLGGAGPRPKRGPLDSIRGLIRRVPKGLPPVGQTPHSVVWTENKWRLLRFAPRERRYGTPVER